METTNQRILNKLFIKQLENSDAVGYYLIEILEKSNSEISKIEVKMISWDKMKQMIDKNILIYDINFEAKRPIFLKENIKLNINNMYIY